jgi:hypothetical protein
MQNAVLPIFFYKPAKFRVFHRVSPEWYAHGLFAVNGHNGFAGRAVV